MTFYLASRWSSACTNSDTDSILMGFDIMYVTDI